MRAEIGLELDLELRTRCGEAEGEGVLSNYKQYKQTPSGIPKWMGRRFTSGL